VIAVARYRNPDHRSAIITSYLIAIRPLVATRTHSHPVHLHRSWRLQFLEKQVAILSGDNKLLEDINAELKSALDIQGVNYTKVQIEKQVQDADLENTKKELEDLQLRFSELDGKYGLELGELRAQLSEREEDYEVGAVRWDVLVAVPPPHTHGRATLRSPRE